MATAAAGVRARWLALCGRVGVSDAHADAWWARVSAAYAEPQRHYHTLDHLADMLATLDHAVRAGGACVHDADVLELALFFHDIVYEVDAARYAQNEERSAALLGEMVAHTRPARLTDAQRDAALAIIRATRTHDVGAESALAGSADVRADAELLLDVDLAVLAREPAGYAAYAAQIRREFAHYDDAAFRAGRARVLRHLLDKPALFASAARYAFARDWEARARANLAAELAQLVAVPAHQ